MLSVGSYLVIDNQINVGQFIAADIVIIAIMSSVEKLISSLDTVYDTLTSIEKLSKVIDSDIEISGTRELQPINKGVEVEFINVNFGYGEKEVLKNLSFKIQAGQTICLSGASGSGKSSVLRLLTGAFTNFTGTILIDNAPIGNYSLKSLRSQTGILLSQQDIFNGTLLENLTLGSPDISIEEVTKLSDKLNLKDFIKTYKDGYDAVLDAQGKKINANIRQEILLVRALVGKHRLLLLENPFNNLEPQEIVALLDYLQTENNATIIITSEANEIKNKCNMVINLK